MGPGYDPYNTVTARTMELVEWDMPPAQEADGTVTLELLLPEHCDDAADAV